MVESKKMEMLMMASDCLNELSQGACQPTLSLAR